MWLKVAEWFSAGFLKHFLVQITVWEGEELWTRLCGFFSYKVLLFPLEARKRLCLAFGESRPCSALPRLAPATVVSLLL